MRRRLILGLLAAAAAGLALFGLGFLAGKASRRGPGSAPVVTAVRKIARLATVQMEISDVLRVEEVKTIFVFDVPKNATLRLRGRVLGGFDLDKGFDVDADEARQVVEGPPPARADPLRRRPAGVVRREIGLSQSDHARRPHALDDLGARRAREVREGGRSLRRRGAPRARRLLRRGGRVRLDGRGDRGRSAGGAGPAPRRRGRRPAPRAVLTGRRPLASRSVFVAIRITSISHQIPQPPSVKSFTSPRPTWPR